MVLKRISHFFRARSYQSRSVKESAWRAIGAVKDLTSHEQNVVFRCTNGNIIVRWLSHDLIYVQFQSGAVDFDALTFRSGGQDESIPVPFKVVDGQDSIEIYLSSVICRIDKAAFCLSLETLDGQLLCRDASGIQMQINGTLRLSMLLQPDESSYGLAAQGAGFNLRGKRLTFRPFVSDFNQQVPDLLQYYSIPFYLGVHKHGVYGVFWDNLQPGFVDVGAAKANEWSFESGGGELSYFLIAASDVESVLNKFTELTGRIDLPSIQSLDQQHISLQPATQNGVPVHQRSLNMIAVDYPGAPQGRPTAKHPQSDWDNLQASIGSALNMGLAGVPLIGIKPHGFSATMSVEFYARWLQVTCFMPVSFSHNVGEMLPYETEALQQSHGVIKRQVVALRYRFLPYLYSVVALCHEYGWPVIRPVFMLEPNNLNIRDISDCFLLGEAVLVAPVVNAGAVVRNVYLPAGQWYDYWTDRLFEGGQIISVPAPLERLPLFIKAGSIIPMWSDKNDADENEKPTITYRVYPGQAETVLYEDTGEGFNYQKGDYRWIYISSDWDSAKLIIKRRIAGRYVPNYQQIEMEIVGLSDEPSHVRIDRQGAPIWFFDDGVLEMTADDKFQQIEVKI